MFKNKTTLILHRKYGEKGTNGTITYQGKHICHSIELPNRNNLQRLSCIPEGCYKLAKIAYYKHGEQIGIPSVLGRESILIHPGNDAIKDLQGCIAPVTQHTGDGTGTESVAALTTLKALVYGLWDMELDVFLLIKRQSDKRSACVIF